MKGHNEMKRRGGFNHEANSSREWYSCFCILGNNQEMEVFEFEGNYYHVILNMIFLFLNILYVS